MGYATTKELNEMKKVLKSAKIKGIECAVPSADANTIAKTSANSIIEQALTQANDIKKKATDEVNVVFEKARKDAFAQGQAEAKKKYDTLLKAMQLSLESIEEIKKEITGNLSESIIALAMEIAASIMKTEITTDPLILRSLAMEVLSKISPARETTLRFHPSDFEALKDFRPEFESAAGFPDKFRMTHDASLGRGDVVVQYERGTIDARIATQLENIARSLMECPGE